MNIIPTCQIPKDLVSAFFQKHWGSPQMVISSGIYNCDELDGYGMLNDDNQIVGLITYIFEVDACEIISLDSVIENKGIGTALLEKAEEACRERNIKQIKLITTNDNIHALAFYQKRGYRLDRLFVNAVETARKMKPEIPLLADNKIPIRDELLLVKELQ
nr:yxbD [Bacillus subtilis]